MAEKGYLLRVLSNASFDRMKQVVDTVHERSGKNKLAIFLDMAKCTALYGAGYYDYEIFAFYNLTAKQRKTFVTRLVSKKLNTFLNDPAYIQVFENKDEFNDLFRKYVRRGYLKMAAATAEDVAEFIKGKEYVFAKPQDAECGHGCEKILVADYPDPKVLFDHLKECNICLLEDCIKQHPAESTLYPHAVNCMRVITLLDDDGEAHCLYVVQKMGKDGSFIDNNCLFTPVDIETGKIKYPAHSGDTTLGIIYEEHPNTHVHLQGYQIPFVKEAVAMCLEAAKVVPQVRYVGWDVAITEDGPEFIEGNTYCAHDFWQLPPHTPDGIGMLPVFEKYVKDFKR